MSEVILKGNELSWLLTLAESRYMSKEFQDWITKNKLKKTEDFLKVLFCKFHPNNFDAGTSKTVWILKRKES